MPIEDLLSGRLSGQPLALAARALRQPKIAAIGADVLRRELGIDQLAALVEGAEPLEADVAPRSGRPPRPRTSSVEPPEAPPWALTSPAIAGAYRKGRTTPEKVLERLLMESDRLAERQPLLACLWTRDPSARADAQASTQRLRAGQARGPLEGVPIVIKEQIAVRGLPRRLGHELPGPSPMAQDATLVARLREAGAVIVGQTAMTELGLSPVGVNPKRPPLRNPHHLERTAGGSSTGAGIAVAVGLTPIAVGADGGGSVRIPSAICGVYGLKPSFGRVSRAGDAVGGSLNQTGPLGASTLDLALYLDAVAGPDPADPASLHALAPSAPFAEAVRAEVRGLRIGVDEHDWRDADTPIQRACERALRALEERGCVLVDVKLPLSAHAVAMGSLTIAAETYAATARAFALHREAFGLDVQVYMYVSEQLEAREFLWGQMLRERLRRQVARAFLAVDALAAPSTAKTALPVTETDERTGRLDAAGVKAMCRYTFLGNLTGLPAGSVPVGLDPEGLPIGLQIIGDAWDEGTVLALMAELERSGAARSPRSPHHLAILED